MSLVEGVSDAAKVEYDGEYGPSGGIKNYGIWTVVRLALSLSHRADLPTQLSPTWPLP